MKIERILVRGTNWIGDAVMSTPALERLRSSFPGARITLLANPLTAGLFGGSPFIDEVVEYRRREDGARAFFAALRAIRSGRFDMALLFQNAFEAALLAWLGGVPIRIGYAEQGRGLLLTGSLRRGLAHRNRHQIHDYLDLVAEAETIASGRRMDGAAGTPAARLVAGPNDRQAARELLEAQAIPRGPGPLVALNTGATNSRAKCWPAESFARLASMLVADYGAVVVLIGGAGERQYAESVERAGEARLYNLAGKTSLAQLIGLLESCDLLVSNDTGPAHIGAALGCPALTIFGPTNEFETSPTGPSAGIVRAEGIECARCMHRDCPIDHRCMTRISPDEVFRRAAAILDRKFNGRP